MSGLNHRPSCWT